MIDERIATVYEWQNGQVMEVVQWGMDARFWRSVQKTDGCWLWTGSVNNHGYGIVRRAGRRMLVHRYSWEQANGPIPVGALCLHHCDVPACVRPDHLFLGTQSDNVRDMAAKGRHGRVTHPERTARGDGHGTHLHPDSVLRGAAHYTQRRPDIVRRGEQIKTSKLTAEQVRQIRQRADEPRVIIAADYGVTPEAISAIINRKNWRHL